MSAAHALQNLLRTLPAAATATFLALFPIVNPFGAVPLFFTITTGFTPRDRNRTALKTATYVFWILVTFLFFGRFVLNFFGTRIRDEGLSEDNLSMLLTSERWQSSR